MILLEKKWQDAVNQTAQTGAIVEARTDVSIILQDDTVSIRFHCKDNPYLAFNRYDQDNEPLYNQEVFELFISGGPGVSDRYLEIEVNPVGALWAGIIHNPGLGLDQQPLQTEFLHRSTHKIQPTIWANATDWGGTIVFPATLIPGYPARSFRFNVYRILAKTQPQDNQWACSVDNAHFLCLHTTLSGSEPAFHRPEMFGFLP